MMECIAFSLQKYDIKVPFIDNPTYKAIAPILSAIYKEVSNDTPQQVIIKDYEVIIDEELLKKTPLTQQNITRNLDRLSELIKNTAIIETEGSTLDAQARTEVFSNSDLYNDVYGNTLFFFAMARYLGKEVLKQSEPPLIVDYSTTPTQ